MRLSRYRPPQIKPRLGTNRYLAYVRVSSKPQEELSLDAQTLLIHEYAQRNGLEVVRIFEEVKSARESGNRPQFIAFMETLANDPTIQGVIAHKLNRVSRNTPELALLEDYLVAGVDFRFVAKHYDDSPAGRLHLRIQAAVARHEIENLT